MSKSIAENWRDLSGQHYWKDLLDPLDNDLRRYIIHYGEMAQATYDAFNSDKASKYAGRSRYGKAEFFSKVGLEKGNPFKYEVTRFLYATVEIDFLVLNGVEESNWIGYVAVATDEGKAVLGRRDIVIAWRGTQKSAEWVKDVQFLLNEAPQIFGDDSHCKVHRGFYSIYTADNSCLDKTSARNQVLNEMRRLVNQFKDEEISITVTGHSLGAALATLNAVDIVTNGYNIPQNHHHQPHQIKAFPVTAIVFASPRVGDSDFQAFFSDQTDLRALHVRNKEDIVPRHPFIGYSEVGQELEIDTQESQYLKNNVGDVAGWHSLEVYLHGVAGTQGSKGGFNLEVQRDIALVNKSLDALKDEYHIPETWRVQENKGLVQQHDGSWKMLDLELKDDDF
ncbi:phospholipase A1-IIgamma-like [Prosopis cineraria]|uniref:phospholipase A1-IIgamma-like n=1 Tax=Prosopis cineraria TaxID=364024 RepID=UPI0024101FBF|nr:phospholipase A1-IIgamma-like [Prosopis cineraria]